eukprot:s1460_g11.t1
MIWRREFVNTFTALGDALHLRGEVLFDPDIALWTVEPRHWTLPNISGFSCLKSVTCTPNDSRKSNLKVSFSPVIEVVTARNTLHVEPLSQVLIADEFLSDVNRPDSFSDSDDSFGLFQTQVCLWHDDAPPVRQCSFTDEFLEAMRIRTQPAVEMTLPETPAMEIDRLPDFVRRLHDLFQARIHDNPEVTEPGPKIETWYLDHVRMKECFQSRSIHLASGFDLWEQQILHEWRDHVDQFMPVDFHLVHPHPEDAEDDSVAQLILHQRPIDGFCSVLLSIYDSAYDDGKPHSYATVLANRISLEVAAVAAEFDEFCQPLHSPTDCTFWFGNLQIRPHQLVAARHGYAFRLKVRRPLEADVSNWCTLNLDDLRHVLTQTLEDAESFRQSSDDSRITGHALPMEVIYPVNDTWQPDWIAAIEEAQTRGHYHHHVNPLCFTTWFLNGHHAPRSLFTRQIILPQDTTHWEAVILNAWTDHVDLHTPCFLHFVDPPPPAASHDTALGHILIVQNAIENHAAILLSASWPHDHARDPVHTALYTINRMSTSAAMTLLPFALTHSFSLRTRVRRGQLVFPATGSPRIGDGDSIVVEFVPLPVESSEVDDAASLFQSSDRVAVQECKNNDHGAVILNDEEIIQPLDRPHRRIRPPIDGNFGWLDELHDIFQNSAEVEVEGESPLMYVQTWFIHHERHTTCQHPCGIRLDNVMITWIDVLRQAWMDHLDPLRPFSVHIVRPSPPKNRLQDHACHIIVEQAQPPHQVASHLTIRFESARSQRVVLSMLALALPRFVSLPDLIVAASLQPQCALRRCSARYGSVPIPMAAIQEIVSGAGLQFRVEPIQDQMPHCPSDEVSHDFRTAIDDPFDSDAFSLMQMHSDCKIYSFESTEFHSPWDALDMPLASAPEEQRYHMPTGLNPAAAVFHPSTGSIADQTETIQDLFVVWEQTAFAWENEDPTADIATWFVDHSWPYPRCTTPRHVRLDPDFSQWEQKILRTWSDLVHPGLSQSMYLVSPQPPYLEPNIVAHLIVVQAEHDEWVSNLVTVFDSFIGHRGRDFVRLVLTTDQRLHLEHVITGCGYTPDSVLPTSLTPCLAWIDNYPLLQGHPWLARSGHCIILQVQRRVVVMPHLFHSVQSSTMLQTSHHVSKIPVDPVQGQKTQLCLDDLVLTDADQHSPRTLVPLKLRHLGPSLDLPTEIFLEDGFSSEDIEHELVGWGHQRHAYLLASTGLAVTVPLDWRIHAPTRHFIYCPCQSQNPDEVLFHTTMHDLTELDHMKFLHSLGFMRVVILEIKMLRPGLAMILYHNNVPMLESVCTKPKTPTPWPCPQPISDHVPMINFDQLPSERPSHCLSLGVSMEELATFFTSASDSLCPWYSHLDLPVFVRQGIDNCVHQEGLVPDWRQFDRLIIYTDGSSKAHERRQPPLKVADQGTPDAWAYVVLGERYATSTCSGSLTFLGWQTQQVMYEVDNRAFTGTDQIGAEYAEREALLFAGLWRLALNSTIPTIFRTDSSTTADQAAGRAGFTQLHPTHELLRGTFQALQAGMRPAELLIEHVRGHAGDVWNEFVDFLAKAEASGGHHLQRQNIDLTSLRPCRMLIARDAGLPPLTSHGFAAVPPQLPLLDTPALSQAETTLRIGHFVLSLASFNVGSLSVGPDGFSGKLSYLRQQMLAHGINILGVQEARSPPGLSVVDQVLRISGGSDNGKFGVELWISLKQPYAHIAGKAIFFARSNFQLLHHDSRRLLVRVSSVHFDGFLLVLHAPQSGRPYNEREQWWAITNDIATKFCSGLPLFVLMDANAKTGRCCEPIIFHQDDSESSSTPFLREFLTAHALCLPSTCDIHMSEHATWTAPNGLDEHRIDFVAIPQSLLPKCTWSSTVPSLDPGHAHFDHTAVALQLDWKEQCCPLQSKNLIPTHDRNQIQARSALIDFSGIRVSNWQDDIEEHVNQLNSSLHGVLHRACPITPQGPKKSFIDDATWALRVEKLQLRRRIKLTARQKSSDLLACVFRTWSSLSASAPADTSFITEAWNHQTTVLCAELCLVSRYWTVSRKLRKELQMSRNISLSQAIQDVGPSAAAGTLLHTLRPFIGPTNPKKQKKACLPIVKQKDGALCQTPEEAQNRWIEHFQDMEGGARMSFEEYRNIGGMVSQALWIALGLDAIPPELCHYCPASMAKLTYAILMKAVLFGQEAIAHKGGKLAVAWKQKGDVRDCQTHRSLLVSSHLGKTVHRALRQKYNHLYNAYMQRQQLGGRPLKPVAVPLHMTRAFLRWQYRCKNPTALVFLDLTEAFYRTLRPLAVGGEMSDECIGQMCHRLNLAPETMHELSFLLSQPSALCEAGAPAHVQLLLQALHRDTWFQLGTQTDLVRTEIGSRPGDSFADVVFGYLWAKILKGLEDTLVRHEVLEHVADIDLPNPYASVPSTLHPTIPLLGPTWMDDLNIVLTATSNAALVSKTQFALSALIDTCKQHHMEPNLKKGKTEVMFTFCGPESRSYRRHYYSQVSGGLPVVCEASTFQIEVVSRYLHLGGIIHHRDATNQEVQRRFAIANQAYQQHRRALYRNRDLPWHTRCDLFQTLVLSKLTYGIESWTFSTQQCRTRIHSGVMKLYRRLLGGTVSVHMTDLEVLVRTNPPDPTELLRRARLRYFGVLHRCRHQAHWGLLQEDRAWIELLQDDLFWLWCQLDGTSELQDPREHFLQWQDLIVHHGGYWKKLIRRGIRHACLQRQKEFHAIELHERIGRLLLEEHWISHIPQHLTVARPSDPTQVFGCMSCQMSFASYAGESVHMCRSHGRLARERFLFDATHCPCCLKEYHTHSKVLAHLRHSRHCKDTLISRRFQCVPVPGAGSVIDQALHSHTDGALPFQQALGPHLPSVPVRPDDPFDLAFLEAFYLFILDVSLDDSLLEACKRFVLSYPISWTTCCRTLCHMHETLTEDDAAPFAFSRVELLAVLSQMSQQACWPFLGNDYRRPVTIHHATLYEWEVWCSDLAECPPANWCTLQPLPQTLTRYKIILHAFAGRRRRGDIEWFIDSMAHQCSGFVILTVSLDIIIDSYHGDISKAEVRTFWLQYIRCGYVAGFIAGPPCNTWSRARAVALSDRPGPRVIRTPSEPWGLQTLRLGELDQIILGTILLGFSLECLLALALHSGSGLIEHPRASDDDQAVSIWKLPIVHLLLQIPHIRLIHLAQGLFGAPSPKPTSLMVLRLPALEKCLHAGMIARELPFGVTTGRDDSGHFNTAPLKEYPPGLCRAIAEGFIKEFIDFSISVDHDTYQAMPEEFFELCRRMRDGSFGDYIGKD